MSILGYGDLHYYKQKGLCFLWPSADSYYDGESVEANKKITIPSICVNYYIFTTIIFIDNCINNTY